MVQGLLKYRYGKDDGWSLSVEQASRLVTLVFYLSSLIAMVSLVSEMEYVFVSIWRFSQKCWNIHNLYSGRKDSDENSRHSVQDVVDIRNLSLVYTLAGGRSFIVLDRTVFTSFPFYLSSRLVTQSPFAEHENQLKPWGLNFLLWLSIPASRLNLCRVRAANLQNPKVLSFEVEVGLFS